MKHVFRHAACAATVLGSLLLTACGGGSEDDGTAPVKPAISEETARLRRMGLPEGAATPSAAAVAVAAAEAASAAAR